MKLHKFILAICCSILIASSIIWSIEKTKEIKYNKSRSNEAQIISSIPTLKPIEDIDKNILLKEITEKDTIDKPKAETIIQAHPATKSDISAEAYLIGNLKTGEIYKSFNPDKVFPIASVSKLYTSLVAKYLLGPERIVTITQSALDTYGDAGQLVLNEKWTAEELLYPLLLESSNDVAKAFAEVYGEEAFIVEMNAFAQEIGMYKTQFKDPSGLSSANISNASDLFTLARYLYENESDLLKISNTKEIVFATTTEHGAHHFKNINPYVHYSGFIGGKTGRTNEAKESMVSLFKEMEEINNQPLAIIVLRSDFGEREKDTEKILGFVMFGQ